MTNPTSRGYRIRNLFWLLIPLLILVQPALSIPDLDPAWPAAAGLAALVVLYVAVLASLLGLLPGLAGVTAYRLRLLGLGLLAALGVALATAYGGGQGGMLPLVLVAGAGACVLASPRVALGWVAATTAATAGIAAQLEARFGDGAPSAELFWITLVVGTVGISFYFGRRTYQLIDHLHRTRAELAEAAVEAERLRFSRDLHDLLGHTLSLIVVKAEVAKRLAGQDPAAAARESGQIEKIGRRALAEVREAVAGYRQRDLATELAAARTALSTAGIGVTVRATDLPSPADGLLGWVVREAATNVVRHSQASHCHIEVSRQPGQATLEIRDDGLGTGSAGTGRGLAGLRERLTAAGGELTAGPAERGWRLVATVPVSAPVPAPAIAPAPAPAAP